LDQNTIIRIARPTDNLKEIGEMYKRGLDFSILAQFENHYDFDGLILGKPKLNYHIEFTHHRGTKVGKAPTKDNLLVFYVQNSKEWKKDCDKMKEAGFREVESYNPYWDIKGKTFEDIDGYRVVLQNQNWEL
jgi:hypothetical protein